MDPEGMEKGAEVLDADGCYPAWRGASTRESKHRLLAAKPFSLISLPLQEISEAISSYKKVRNVSFKSPQDLEARKP